MQIFPDHEPIDDSSLFRGDLLEIPETEMPSRSRIFQTNDNNSSNSFRPWRDNGKMAETTTTTTNDMKKKNGQRKIHTKHTESLRIGKIEANKKRKVKQISENAFCMIALKL